MDFKKVILTFTMLACCVPILASEVTFDDSIVKARAEKVKAKIRASIAESRENINLATQYQDHNKRESQKKSPQFLDLPFDVTIYLEREQNRLKNQTCFDMHIRDALKDGIKNNCQFDDLFIFCENKQKRIQESYVQSHNRFTALTAHKDSGALEYLVRLREELVGLFKQSVALNDSCSNHVYDQVINSNCLTTYDLVFNDKKNELLGNSCTEESIDFAVREFSRHMRDQVTFRLSQIYIGHVDSRRLETKIAQILVDVDEAIKKLEAPKRLFTSEDVPSG